MLQKIKFSQNSWITVTYILIRWPVKTFMFWLQMFENKNKVSQNEWKMCLHLCLTILQYNSFICYSVFISSKVLPGTRVIFSFLSLTQSLTFRDAKHEKNLVFVGQEMLNRSSNTVIQLNSPVLRHPERMILWKWGIEFLFVLFYNEQHK